MIQGYIANFHFNARSSAVKRNGEFTLMSIKLGEGMIRTSTTKSLRPIRNNKQSELGWKRGEISILAQFRDMDPVDVVPLILVKNNKQINF